MVLAAVREEDCGSCSICTDSKYMNLEPSGVTEKTHRWESSPHHVSRSGGPSSPFSATWVPSAVKRSFPRILVAALAARQVRMAEGSRAAGRGCHSPGDGLLAATHQDSDLAPRAPGILPPSVTVSSAEELIS